MLSANSVIKKPNQTILVRWRWGKFFCLIYGVLEFYIFLTRFISLITMQKIQKKVNGCCNSYALIFFKYIYVFIDIGQEFFHDGPVFIFARLIDSAGSKPPTHLCWNTFTSSDLIAKSVLASNLELFSYILINLFFGAVVKVAMLARASVLIPLWTIYIGTFNINVYYTWYSVCISSMHISNNFINTSLNFYYYLILCIHIHNLVLFDTT